MSAAVVPLERFARHWCLSILANRYQIQFQLFRYRLQMWIGPWYPAAPSFSLSLNFSFVPPSNAAYFHPPADSTPNAANASKQNCLHPGVYLEYFTAKFSIFRCQRKQNLNIYFKFSLPNNNILRLNCEQPQIGRRVSPQGNMGEALLLFCSVFLSLSWGTNRQIWETTV